ncbi:hypothetical protein [Spirosoma sordidisoli]|uniref:DUF1360 domain-containing protein n=1 Tax=Spirosoma sordidisoli TaxID=2502893 RepID=A0A4Q2UMK8_9BACT|nr:hypothetical protein [Spirosoma sordidisoli]RYC70863.1 hypothetical protein EQG79_01545 [Spirosoma sordidisoli]
MLLALLITALCGTTGVMLAEKWEIDDYMNTHGFWCKYWPAQPCLLCRGFWIGFAVFALLQLIPCSIYVFVPLAAIPLQVWLNKIIN